MDSPVPQKTPYPSVNGEFNFSCCGQNHTVKGFLQEVQCPLCTRVYKIGLLDVPLGGMRGSPNRHVRLLQEVTTKAGSTQVVLKKNDIYKVGSDPHGMLGTLQNQTLLQVKVKGRDIARILLAPVDDNCIEDVKEELRNGFVEIPKV